MKNFFAKIFAFLHVLFGGGLETWISDNVQPAIDFVEKLKAFLSSPAADIIAALIPGNIAEEVKTLLLANIGKALDALEITEEINNAATTADKLTLLTQYLLTLSPNIRNAVFMKIASQLAKTTGNTDTIKGYSVDLLVQSQYAKQAATADGTITADDNTAPVADVAPVPVADVAPAPVADVAPAPVADVAPAPVADVAPAPVADVAPAPVADVAPAPVADVAPAPVADVAPAPVADVAPAAVADVTPAAVADVTPAAVADVTPAAVADVAPAATAPVGDNSATTTAAARPVNTFMNH